MNVKLKIFIGNGMTRKINAVKAMREIVGVGHPKGGLTECKDFVESNSDKWTEIVMTDAQFGRLYIMAREKAWHSTEFFLEHDSPERFLPEDFVDLR